MNLIITHDLPPLLSDVLPPSYTYIFHNLSLSSNETFVSCVTINILDECGVKTWLDEFHNHNNTTYRVTRGSRFQGKRVLYKTERHCQHKRKESNGKSKSEKKCLKLRNKKTNCPSTLILKLYNSRYAVTGSHPCELVLHWEHNHTTNSAKALLSFRPINEDTKFENFVQGHSPSSALHFHQLNLAATYEGNEKELERYRADRSTNPMYKDVYYLSKNGD